MPWSEARIACLCAELGSYHGYRTLWLDTGGGLRHAEPDEEHERFGWRYLFTAMQPSLEELEALLKGAMLPSTGGETASVPVVSPSLGGFMPAPA